MVDGEHTVKHYHIRTLDDGGFFIAAKHTFSTLAELVQFHSSEYNKLSRC